MLEVKVNENLHFSLAKINFFSRFFFSCKPIQDTVFIFFIMIIHETMGSGAVMTNCYLACRPTHLSVQFNNNTSYGSYARCAQSGLMRYSGPFWSVPANVLPR